MPSDANRNDAGQFAKGNQCARKHGLYGRCQLNTSERRLAMRVRKHLREAGLPTDTTAALAVSWVGASRAVEGWMRLDGDEERAEGFAVFERATAIQRQVLAIRDRAIGKDGAPEPDELGDALEQAVRSVDRVRLASKGGLR